MTPTLRFVPSRVASVVHSSIPRQYIRRFTVPPLPHTTRLSPAPRLRTPGNQFSRSYASVGKAGTSKNQFKVLPFLFILVAGSGGFYMLVQSRKDPMPALEDPSQKPRLAEPVKKPTFSSDEVTVIFVLGGPGAGKGTQCANLVRDYGFVHLSAGDLLRAEQNRPGSEVGELIKSYMKEGKIVPMNFTITLLENAMKEIITTQNKTKFLIDGFPRRMDQSLKFEDEVCQSKFVLFFDCPEDVLLKRLLKRGETSGRIDDNIDTIKKRFKTFLEESYPVVEYFDKHGKAVRLDATLPPDEVYSQVKKSIADKLKSA